MTDRKKPRKASRSARKTAIGKPVLQRLSAQQERFVSAYLNILPRNATEAYIAAGYRARGASARTAASRLLLQPAVKEAIEAARTADVAKFDVTRERMIYEYAKIAFSDPRDFFHENGTLKHPVEMNDASAGILVQYEVQEEYADLPTEEALEDQAHGGKLKRRAKHRVAIGRLTKMKWADKRAALDSLVRLMGYAKDNSTLGTPQNPVHMMLADMQGRSNALVPVATPLDDGDDD